MKRLICLLMAMVLLLCGCANAKEPVQETIFSMNTVMDLKVWGKDAEEAMTQIKHILTDLENTWSVTSEDSLISHINAGKEMLNSIPTLLEHAQALSDRTGGSFDPHLHAVSKAWGFYNEAYRIPTDAEIAQALQDPQWDLGGILKGYAGQQCADLLYTMDVDQALLVLGGNVQTFGSKSDGTPWKIGIQNPDGGEPLGIISVTGTTSVITSGDYQRYFEQDGITYHHILDPKTGYPADSGLRSVTVISRNGMTADALSTALFVMGLKEASNFWRMNTDFEAVFVTSEGKIYATEGAALSGCVFEVITREY